MSTACPSRASAETQAEMKAETEAEGSAGGGPRGLVEDPPRPSTAFLVVERAFRRLLPLAYLLYVLASLASVHFGAEHYERLHAAPCYRRALG